MYKTFGIITLSWSLLFASATFRRAGMVGKGDTEFIISLAQGVRDVPMDEHKRFVYRDIDVTP